VFVAPDDPVKLSLLSVTNESPRRRRLSLYAFVEWALGPPRPG
jgi:cyclic beta-1,2-glucan synthetase